MSFNNSPSRSPASDYYYYAYGSQYPMAVDEERLEWGSPEADLPMDWEWEGRVGGEWEEGEDRLGGRGEVEGGRVGGGMARPRPIPLVAFHRGLEPELAPVPGRGQERRGTPPNAPPAGAWALGRGVAPPEDRRGQERREAPNAPPAVPHPHVLHLDRDHEDIYAYDDAPYLGEWGRQAREQREERLRQSRGPPRGGPTGGGRQGAGLALDPGAAAA